MSKDLLDRLSKHRLLSTIPPEQIAWVAEHGVLHQLERDDVLTAKTTTVAGLHIVLDGHVSIYVDRGAGRRKIMEWRGGEVTGLMPFSRLVSPPGDVTAEEPTDVVTVLRKDFPEMIRDCNELTAVLVHVMLDRARHFTSSFLHDEKLVSIGKLAAGLAHELNNPVSAIARSSRALASSFSDADQASLLLGSEGLSTEQHTLIKNVCEALLSGSSEKVQSPLEQEDRESAIAAWLDKHGVDADEAEALADIGMTVDLLNGLAQTIPRQSLRSALRWTAASTTARRMTAEINEAASRIHQLVDAVKGFTQMDRESVPEPVDIAQGLRNTLVVMRSRAKDKAVSLTLEIPADLPLVQGFAGELNQVWANLIGNALDAVSENGNVKVSATHERDGVAVRVVDDGPGVPIEIRDRIFDPFFTTKPVGQGSGLGLDIVRRLVQRHNGRIELDSKPGSTEFRVILP
jgi:signal transduction histidine kinase